jgi:hypothetical protein
MGGREILYSGKSQDHTLSTHTFWQNEAIYDGTTKKTHSGVEDER